MTEQLGGDVAQTDDGVTFDCPKCDHISTHYHPITGFLFVFWHFFAHHGWYSFKVGMPLFDESPPEFGGVDDDE